MNISKCTLFSSENDDSSRKDACMHITSTYVLLKVSFA